MALKQLSASSGVNDLNVDHSVDLIGISSQQANSLHFDIPTSAIPSGSRSMTRPTAFAPSNDLSAMENRNSDQYYENSEDRRSRIAMDLLRAKEMKYIMKGASDFVRRLYRMLTMEGVGGVVSWNNAGDGLIIHDLSEFSKGVLTKYFKHNNVASFIRQLNKYDFHKAKRSDLAEEGIQMWEFSHSKFRRNQPELLCQVKRKCLTWRKARLQDDKQLLQLSPPTQTSSAPVSLEEKVDNLVRVQQDLANLLRQVSCDYQSVISELSSIKKNAAIQQQHYREQEPSVLKRNRRSVGEFLPGDPIINPLQNSINKRAIDAKRPKTTAVSVSSSFPALDSHQYGNTTTHSSFSLWAEAHLNQRNITSSTGSSGSSSSTLQNNATTHHVNFINDKTSTGTTNLQLSQNQSPFPLFSQQQPSLYLPTHDNFSAGLLSPSATGFVQYPSSNHSSGNSSSGNSSLHTSPFSKTLPTQFYANQYHPSQQNPIHGSTSSRQSQGASIDANSLGLGNLQTEPRIIPKYRALLPLVPSSLTNPTTSHSSYWSITPKVLLVEDDIVCRKMSQKLLQLSGCVYDVATDGLEAVKKMNKVKYDIVLMDVFLPHMDGMSAAKTIRKFDSTTPIISMTNHVTDELCVQYFAAGMSDILPKPFCKETLSMMLERHCSHLKGCDVLATIGHPLRDIVTVTPESIIHPTNDNLSHLMESHTGDNLDNHAPAHHGQLAFMSHFQLNDAQSHGNETHPGHHQRDYHEDQNGEDPFHSQHCRSVNHHHQKRNSSILEELEGAIGESMAHQENRHHGMDESASLNALGVVTTNRPRIKKARNKRMNDNNHTNDNHHYPETVSLTDSSIM